MVWPSGAALATMLAPIVPPAPGRFSITKVCPTCFPTCSKTTRAMTSLATPAGIGKMTVTLREGQSCATADVSVAINKIALNVALRNLVCMDASSAAYIERQPVVRRVARSIAPDVRRLDHRAPQLGLGLRLRRKLLWGRARRHDAERGEPCLGLIFTQHRAHVAIDLAHDLGRRL